MDQKAGALSRWERFYWSAFATAVVVIGGLKLYNSFEKPPPVVRGLGCLGSIRDLFVAWQPIIRYWY